MKKTLFLLVGMLFVLASCNKTNKVSKQFIDAGEWRVTTLSVDGTNEAELPKLELEDCADIYEAVCGGEWKNDEGGHAEFVWQFRDKGETFEISHQAEEGHEHEHEHDHAAEEAAAQCYAFSGVYTVTSSSKDMMEFTSTATVGHAGKTVIFKIEK
jgi:hypothetical protein